MVPFSHNLCYDYSMGKSRNRKGAKTMKNLDVKTLLKGKVSENTVVNYGTSWRMYLDFCGDIEEALKPSSLVDWREHDPCHHVGCSDSQHSCAWREANCQGVV